jgi:uncharacterized protein (TIGR03066 family)
MRSLLLCALVAQVAHFSLSADDKKADPIDAKKLVGKWRAKEGAPGGFDFKGGGKVTMIATLADQPVKFEGTYKVDGNKLVVTVEFGGKDQATAFTVTKLTDTELVMRDEKGKEVKLSRIKDK